MGRTRVDDEEALIPRSDQEEYHPTVRKRKGRCSCIGIKCCFGMFLILVLVTICVFYFIYPSFVPENLGKLKGYFCDESGSIFSSIQMSITCYVFTSPSTAQNALAVNKTWARYCTKTYFIYQKSSDQAINVTAVFPGLKGIYGVDDVTSFEYLNVTGTTDVTTSWILRADDTTYVASHRLEKYLSSGDIQAPLYIRKGSDDADVQVPYILNKAFVKLLKPKDSESDGIANAQKLANNTVIKNEKFSEEFANIADVKLSDLTNVTMFHGVTAGQMYSFFVTSGDDL